MIQITDTVKHLIIINVIVFILVHYIFGNQAMLNLLALHSAQSPLFEPWQLITHIFMHGDFSHILFNMFALWMFGSQLESMWGAKKFVTFYLFTGVGAALVYLGIKYLQINYQLAPFSPETIDNVLTNGADVLASGKNYKNDVLAGVNYINNTTMVGASGAISGLLMAFGILFPNAELALIFLPIPIKAKYFIPLIIIYETSMHFAGFSWDNIAHLAHLSGMLIGFILIKIWKRELHTNH